MAEFQFKSGVKTLDVKGANGEETLSFEVNVGQKEQTKKWIGEISKVETVYNDLSKNDSMVDGLEKMEQDIVTSVLGSEAWPKLWVLCEENVFAMLGFISYLSKFLKESMEGFYKDYV